MMNKFDKLYNLILEENINQQNVDKNNLINIFDEIDDKDAKKEKLILFQKKLSEKQLEVLRLKFLNTDEKQIKTDKEIGEQVGLTTRETKYLIERILNKLKLFAKQENFFTKIPE